MDPLRLPEAGAPPARDGQLASTIRRGLGAAIGAAAVFVLGYLAAPGTHPGAPPGEGPTGAVAGRWTCSMHPQIQLPAAGKCPICFMDLIPVSGPLGDASSSDAGSAALVLSPRARELAEIETSRVEYRPLGVSVRMAGRIEYDETRLGYVSAWVAGRIDRLFANFVGVEVEEDDHLYLIYSPELRTAQDEYLIAARRRETAAASGDADEVASAEAVRDATRRRLELLGISSTQLEELLAAGRTDDRVTIRSPVGGTIIARDAYEGRYVEAGERLFTIADLSKVWAVLDAYEIDLAWLRYGEEVEFETESYPGETFTGRIAFLQPFVDEMTRTVKVRVNVPNPGLRLKAGMFVRARARVTLDESGRIREPDLGGKWMCRMHPEVIADGPGICSDCEMDLAPATSLGFGRAEAPAQKVLSVPVTAPLLTGTRAIVYVEERGSGETRYVARAVRLGTRAGDYWAVLSGLAEGEWVVTRGNFKIDAALQIRDGPSLMGGGVPPVPPLLEPRVAGPLRSAVDLAVSLGEALAADDSDAATRAIGALGKVVRAASSSEAVSAPMAALRDALPAAPPGELEAQRLVLAAIAPIAIEAARVAGHDGDAPIREAFCPMARGGAGGVWLQRWPQVRNPYFGARMLSCGEIRREYPPRAGARDE